MERFIAFAVSAIYDDGELDDFVERLYWVEADTLLEAFDEATKVAEAYAAESPDDREFVGITEIMPVLADPVNGNAIGHRMYERGEEEMIRESVMTREEFVHLIERWEDE